MTLKRTSDSLLKRVERQCKIIHRTPSIKKKKKREKKKATHIELMNEHSDTKKEWKKNASSTTANTQQLEGNRKSRAKPDR